MRAKFTAFFLLVVFLFSLCPIASDAALREGDRGESVRKVQQKLSSWGYLSGGVDGIFGPKTTSAVKYFQRKNGLVVDGIVGSKTLAALGLSSLDKPSSSSSSSYSQNIELLARMIAAEGRGEPYTGQVAIGAVIMNRIKHPSFPNTLSGVLYQRGAFSAIDDGQFYSTPIPDSCRRAAIEAYNGSDPTGGCIYYYNPAKTTNAYMLSKPIYLRIGNHVFCR